MKTAIWVEAEIDYGDETFCGENCPFQVETKACHNCIAFDKLLRFDEISYRWYRCDKCIHNQIGKRYNK